MDELVTRDCTYDARGRRLDPTLDESSVSKPIVLVVEDDPTERGRLAAAVTGSQHLVLGASVATRDEACAWIRGGGAPDVALVDLGPSGLEVIASLAARGVPVLVVTGEDDPETVLSALSAGAVGHLLENVDELTVEDALRSAAAGGAPMTPRVARHVLDAWLGRGRPRADTLDPRVDPRVAQKNVDTLTNREREVLVLLARGMTYADVAQTLGIGHGTVQSYVKNVYGKLQVSSKAEAAALATRLGLTG